MLESARFEQPEPAHGDTIDGTAQPMQTILLASGSPRRRQLLRQAGLEPLISPVDLAEIPLPGETPGAMVERLAAAKAQVAAGETDDGAVILTADTTVVADGQILGKPADAADAVGMLLRLRGRPHQVITAICLLERASGREFVASTQTELHMRWLEAEEIERYVAGGSPLDKAGAYGIQDEDFQPVDMDQFDGCFTNVMGLPLCTVGWALGQLGWDVAPRLTLACFGYRQHELPAWSVAS